MRNKIREFWKRVSEKTGFENYPAPVRWVIRLFSNNLGLKLMSLLLAILLWNYVVLSDTSITRAKTLYNITGYISGQSTLNAYGLALLNDPTEMLSDIAVTIEAPQADYAHVSADNVQVTLDLSNVRSAGTREVPFRATTYYGKVVNISPESIKLTFETLDSRTVAVNPVISGEAEDYWYSISRTNPSLLTVSGASSTVQSIITAQVNVDVTGIVSSTTPSLPYVLLDASGETVPQTMLNRSTSSISVNLDVYPSREIPISTELSSIISGQPAPGYVVQSVSVQPETVSVAAERELLDSLEKLVVEPVSVDDASQSFSARASISRLSDFKHVSVEQVYVNVNIVEETASAYLENINVVITGKGENLTATYEPLGAFVSGPRSQIEQLQKDGFTVTADVSNLGAGRHTVPPTYDDSLYPEIDVQLEAVSVTLTENGSDE